jgi:L-lactate dehydrogenase complex protein LldG
MNVFPDTHIVLGYTSQLVPDIEEGLSLIQKKYGPRIPSMISMITGPSRTADIEKTLVMGMHGPRELILLLVEVLYKL